MKANKVYISMHELCNDWKTFGSGFAELKQIHATNKFKKNPIVKSSTISSIVEKKEQHHLLWFSTLTDSIYILVSKVEDYDTKYSLVSKESGDLIKNNISRSRAEMFKLFKLKVNVKKHIIIHHTAKSDNNHILINGELPKDLPRLKKGKKMYCCQNSVACVYKGYIASCAAREYNKKHKLE